MRRFRVTIVAVEKQQVLYSLCVCSLSYPARKAHAPYYIVICGLSGCTTFFHIISQTALLSGKKIIEHKMCFFFIFSTTLIWNISHFKKKSARDIVRNVHISSCKVSVIIVKILIKLEIHRQINERYSKIKFHQNPSSGSRRPTWRN